MTEYNTYKELSEDEVFEPIDEYWKREDKVMYMMFKDKIKERANIEMILYYKCHMNCNFCWQPHHLDDGMSIDSMWKKIEKVKEYITEVPSQSVDVTFFGGELLGDQVPDSFFEAYKKMAKELSLHAKLINKQFDLCIPSNLNYNNVERVADLFQWFEDNDVSADFEVSYNWMNMYKNEAQLKLVKKNEKRLEKYLGICNTVLTADLVDRIAAGEQEPDPYYDYLYNKYSPNMIVYFSSHYDGADGTKYSSKEKDYGFKPLDQEKLLVAYKWLFEHYPNINVLKDYVGTVVAPHDKKPLECPNNRMLITPDDKIHYCLTFNDCKKGKVLKDFYKARNCYECKYYNSCRAGGECMYEELDPNLKLHKDGCMYFLLFEHIENEIKNNKVNVTVDPSGEVVDVKRVA